MQPCWVFKTKIKASKNAASQKNIFVIVTVFVSVNSESYLWCTDADVQTITKGKGKERQMIEVLAQCSHICRMHLLCVQCGSPPGRRKNRS